MRAEAWLKPVPPVRHSDRTLPIDPLPIGPLPISPLPIGRLPIAHLPISPLPIANRITDVDVAIADRLWPLPLDLPLPIADFTLPMRDTEWGNEAM